ncbi:hypothetical protein EFS03_06520 [Lentilactobacillus buchneri]|uniref:hypothetical protein n=1 Tax=Lentilactobacillus buchneri TaxID=1581 RepID=UPI0021A8E9B9|nr:hypothetical protein [Lentilactobacillus buchneri]MCT3542640.1 hypothetical protein [Lentilactobacillus buchneri]
MKFNWQYACLDAICWLPLFALGIAQIPYPENNYQMLGVQFIIIIGFSIANKYMLKQYLKNKHPEWLPSHEKDSLSESVILILICVFTLSSSNISYIIVLILIFTISFLHAGLSAPDKK